ncbi:MAG: 1,2-dihydroxy-3-keto-5-methylthiopentene dioxygenase [Gammaproteobacteria bacterium]
MTTLAIYPDDANGAPEVLTDSAAIATALDAIGVEYARWSSDAPLAEDADQEAVLAAYRNEVDALNGRYGFESMDVVALRPDHPQKAEFREKFRAEHIHKDFEVRFFVDGSGVFYLHVNDRVYCVLCEAGDLLSVPPDVTHWFDMGADPDFKCIRLFTAAEGWVGHFTGSDIATRFPGFDELRREITV